MADHGREWGRRKEIEAVRERERERERDELAFAGFQAFSLWGLCLSEIVILVIIIHLKKKIFGNIVFFFKTCIRNTNFTIPIFFSILP